MKTASEVEEELCYLEDIVDERGAENNEEGLRILGWIAALQWVLTDKEEVNG